jgi:hypothetical protein
MKCIILPRQARDKHRENAKKSGVFFTGIYPDDGSAFWDISSNVAHNLSGGSWLFAWNDEDEFYLTVCENGPVFHFAYAKNGHFTKRGSGQT